MGDSQGDLRSELLRSMGLVTAIGLDLAILLVLGLFVGHAVDERLHSSPLGLVVGSLAGLAAGAVTAYQVINRVLRR